MRSVNANLLTINQAKSRINQAKKEGKEIRLGDLGVFSVLLISKGAEDADKFTAQNITDVKVQCGNHVSGDYSFVLVFTSSTYFTSESLPFSR